VAPPMPPRAAAPPPGPAAVVLPRTRTPGSGPPAIQSGQAVTDREACRPTPSTHHDAKRNARSQAGLLRDMADTSVHPPFRHRDVLFSPPIANSNHWKEDEQHRTSTSCSNPDRVRLRREGATAGSCSGRSPQMPVLPASTFNQCGSQAGRRSDARLALSSACICAFRRAITR
jgi:hypothetical protein